MSTNMTTFKPSKYLCFMIYNVDDAKIIAGIYTWSQLIFQLNQINTAQSWKIEVNKVVLDEKITKPTKESWKYVKNYIFN
jgi:hypothetical protein